MASNRTNNRTRRTAELNANGVNTKWNNRKGEFVPAEESTRVRRTRAVVEAERAAVTRSLPVTSHRTTYDVYSTGGSNHGGTCQGCGAEIGFWFHYKLCDKCLKGVPVAPRKDYYGVTKHSDIAGR